MAALHVAVILSCCIVQTIVHGCTTKERLFRDLTNDYNPGIDPGKTQLTIGIHLICADFDKETGTVTANVWEQLAWKDSRLKWIPSEYGGIDSIRLPSSSAWTPDIALYTSIRSVEERDTSPNVVVSSDGSALWVTRATYRINCKEGSECLFRIGSWTYDGINLELKAEEPDVFDLQYYQDSCPSVVASHKSEVVTRYYPCCKEPYPTAEISFTLKPRA